MAQPEQRVSPGGDEATVKIKELGSKRARPHTVTEGHARRRASSASGGAAAARFRAAAPVPLLPV